MNELNELRKLSKPELLDRCRELQLNNLEYKKINKKNTKKWFFQKEEAIPEETQMNDKNEMELKMDFKVVKEIPASKWMGSSQLSPMVEEMKRTLSSLLIGEVLHIPVTALYPEHSIEKRKKISSQYSTKIGTAIRHLTKAKPYIKFRIAKRNTELFIERLN